jgi:hypothetical protein
MRPLLFLLTLFALACRNEADKDPTDPDDVPVDTDLAETGPGESDLIDTDRFETDAVDTAPSETDAGDTDPSQDGDGDGTPDGLDCAPGDPTIFVGADEVCDGVDQDCDGETDEDAVDAPLWYADVDGDSYGDPLVPVLACEAPADAVAGDSDCDDSAALVNPAAQERCGDGDDDCDGLVNEDDAVDAPLWYRDVDGDGVGTTIVTARTCTRPVGFAALPGDCDDNEDDVAPGFDEVCDGLDNDCDTFVDEEAIDGLTWYADLDEDGRGDPGSVVIACSPPPLHGAQAGDCDDTRAAAFPGAPEVCNGLDDDCDTLIDEDAVAQGTWYEDLDGDGFGTEAATEVGCVQPPGFAASPADCDDERDDVYPGADELCDGVDQDCDSSIDEDPAVAPTWYLDADEDGFGGDLQVTVACAQPDGWEATDEDCDDLDPSALPGGEEVCDGADNDCNDLVDDEPSDLLAFYRDGDGDGYGDPDDAVQACVNPGGRVRNDDDCNDEAAAARPGGFELCDGLDNDCSGFVDDDAVGAPSWYVDGDEDGYGDDATEVIGCQGPPDAITVGGDCDDEVATISPGADELCGNGDEDCDGEVDEDDAADAPRWFLDLDGDTWGTNSSSRTSCAQPPGHVERGGDCSEGVAAVSPGAAEVCNGVDDDCDGLVDPPGASGETTWFADADGDGFGDEAVITSACDAPEGSVGIGGDCDDTLAEVSPDGTEVCGGADEDCDGTVDEPAAQGAIVWYDDDDGDGYGDAAAAVQACAAPADAVDRAGDCDDALAEVSPDGTEVCGGGDEDCDGFTDEAAAADASPWYLDVDGDGFGVVAVTVTACVPPDRYVAVAGDCHDGEPRSFPGNPEVCDGVDNDCNGAVDGAGAVDAITWTWDGDGDGYGQDGSEVVRCLAPGIRWSDEGGDCDDADWDVNPGAPPACDGSDADCDGLMDNDDDGDLYADASCGGDDCDDDDPAVFPAVRGTCALGGTCYDLLDLGYVNNGIYAVDPDGPAGPAPAFETLCDMGRFGGGWTLVGTVANDGTRRWDSLEAFTTATTFGAVTAPQVDFKSPGWMSIEGLDLLVVTSEYQVGWRGLLPLQSFGDFVADEYNTAQCSQDFLAGPPDLSTGLNADQRRMHDVVVRALDSNASCFPGANENAIVSFTLSSCCWTNGLGNAPNGHATWRTHDLSMLLLDNLVPMTCTAGVYPCNPEGRTHDPTYNSYDTSAKTPWAQVWIR